MIFLHCLRLTEPSVYQIWMWGTGSHSRIFSCCPSTGCLKKKRNWKGNSWIKAKSSYHIWPGVFEEDVMIKINEDYSYTEDYCQFVLTNTFGTSHLMVSSPPQALERTDVEKLKEMESVLWLHWDLEFKCQNAISILPQAYPLPSGLSVSWIWRSHPLDRSQELQKEVGRETFINI